MLTGNRGSSPQVVQLKTELVGGPDGKGLDCKSIALKSSVFDSRTDLQITGVSPQGEAVDCNSIEGFLMPGSIPGTPTILLEGSSIGRAPGFDSGGCRFESCPSSQYVGIV